jgi:hypothetical protein
MLTRALDIRDAKLRAALDAIEAPLTPGEVVRMYVPVADHLEVAVLAILHARVRAAREALGINDEEPTDG